jgi:peroxiredoxin
MLADQYGFIHHMVNYKMQDKYLHDISFNPDIMILQPGEVAPDFELQATMDTQIKLSTLRGKRVILAFYPGDWTLVCGDQMSLYNEMLEYFENDNAMLLGISVDSIWSHQAFSADRHLDFHLLADFEPKGFVAKQFRAYNEDGGYCERALFVIDETGVIAWSFLSPENINPGVDGILDALEAIRESKK